MPVNRLPERKKVENETSATQTKPRRGRPKGSGKMTIQKYAANPPSLPKTDYQRIKELRELMIHSGGKDVANKVIQIALNLWIEQLFDAFGKRSMAGFIELAAVFVALRRLALFGLLLGDA